MAFYENVQWHQVQRQIVHYNWEKITLKSDSKSNFCCSETKDQNIFQNEKLSQTPKNSITKVIKPEQNTKLNNQ